MRIVFILFFLIGSAGFSQVPDVILKRRVDSLVLARMQTGKAVGVAIGIVKNGEVWYNKGYGVKRMNTTDPVDSLTNFHLASVSKVFVATAIMQLVEQGKISLDRKLLDYIPLSKVRDERLRNVTIGQMLTHTSGFPDLSRYNWRHPNNDSMALSDYAKRKIRKTKLKFDPGARMRYSNLAFEVLGSVIESVAGQAFDAYEFENVITRAGLKYSNFDYNKIEAARKSSPHLKTLGRVRPSGFYPYNREHGPSSTLNSCTYDMCQWILEMQTIYDDRDDSYNGVLRHETLMDMWKIKHTSPGPGETIGITWFMEPTPLRLSVMHDGQDPGYLSMLVIYPEQKMGIILLINGSYPFGMIDVNTRVALLLGNKVVPVPVEKLVALEGEYKETKGKWRIGFKVVNGDLVGTDGKYKFNLLPVGDNKFINPDDGASFEFTSTGLIAFGYYNLTKVK